MLPEILGWSAEQVFVFELFSFFHENTGSRPLSQVIGEVMGASNKSPQLPHTSQNDVSLPNEPIWIFGKVPKI